MYTILLTGATGFIGSHLLEALLEEGYRAVILNRPSSDTWRINHLLPKTSTYNIDKISLEDIFKNEDIDYLIHLATCYQKTDHGLNHEAMMEGNVTFPAKLVEIAISHGVKGIINTGTFFEVDCSQQPVKENANYRALNFYARTKIMLDAFLMSHKENTRIITLRLFTPYGERDNQKLVPLLIKKGIRKEHISLSSGLQKLDFTYVHDIVDAYLKALAKLSESKSPSFNLYHIGSGQPTSIRELASLLDELLEPPLNISWGLPSTTDIPIAYASTSKASSELGWTPQHSLHEGLAKTINYYKENM